MQDGQILLLVVIVVGLLVALAILVQFARLGSLWLQAFASGVPVSMIRLLAMKLRRVNPRTIIEAEIQATQADIMHDPKFGITADLLENHYILGGDVPRVIQALVAAKRSGIELDFKQAADIDLADHDILTRAVAER
ncbi:flotillin-like FloA family protein [Adhaeretor mobilis]|nr:flotillin-like FloA family protein [Adhaeretor mobilis]